MKSVSFVVEVLVVGLTGLSTLLAQNPPGCTSPCYTGCAMPVAFHYVLTGTLLECGEDECWSERVRYPAHRPSYTISANRCITSTLTIRDVEEEKWSCAPGQGGGPDTCFNDQAWTMISQVEDYGVVGCSTQACPSTP